MQPQAAGFPGVSTGIFIVELLGITTGFPPGTSIGIALIILVKAPPGIPLGVSLENSLVEVSSRTRGKATRNPMKLRAVLGRISRETTSGTP